jgi:hypothetical protein
MEWKLAKVFDEIMARFEDTQIDFIAESEEESTTED